jgi:hypothetical protein
MAIHVDVTIFRAADVASEKVLLSQSLSAKTAIRGLALLRLGMHFVRQAFFSK